MIPSTQMRLLNLNIYFKLPDTIIVSPAEPVKGKIDDITARLQVVNKNSNGCGSCIEQLVRSIFLPTRQLS